MPIDQIAKRDLIAGTHALQQSAVADIASLVRADDTGTGLVHLCRHEPPLNDNVVSFPTCHST